VRTQQVQGASRDFSATISLELLEVVVIVGGRSVLCSISPSNFLTP